nr:MAG: RNA-dependent RNA polymerase [Mitovirus sp.]
MTQSLKQFFASYKDTSPVRERLLGLGATMNGMLKVKLGRPMLKVLFLIPIALGIKRNLSLVKVLITYLASVHRLWRGGGMRFVVLYLKACFTLVQQSVGGQRLSDTGPFGVRVSRTRAGGLPRLIPAIYRKRIRGGDLQAIRLWLSLFSLYRILDIPGKLKLSTITADSTAKPEWVAGFSEFVPHFWQGLWNLLGFRNLSILNAWKRGGPAWMGSALEAKPELLSKSAPVLSDAAFVAKIASTSPLSLLLSARTWYRDYWKTPLGKAFRLWLSETNNVWLRNAIDTWSRGALDPRARIAKSRDGALVTVEDSVADQASARPVKGRLRMKMLNLSWTKILGKLGTKQEAAGKVRVFAMVDPFTQWIFRPLHEAIFTLLKWIRQDGTHNQVKPLEVLLRRQEGLKRENRAPGDQLTGWYRLGDRYPAKTYSLYSYDLTAATDRLPLSVQIALLAPVVGPTLAAAWGTILVGRDYYISLKDEYGTVSKEALRYSTGQPMGALSSWAMLALTHHCIVQWAWYRVCTQDSRKWRWFSDYAVLGDDIVIMGGRVADAYVSIMTGLGVQIGAHKSLVSRNGTTLEFAKRTFFKGKDVSAVPLPELLVARRNLSAGLELCRKYNLSLGAYCKFLGYGYKALARLSSRVIGLPTRMRRYIVAYALEVLPQSSRNVVAWLAMKTLNSVYALTEKALQSARDSLVQTLKEELLERLAKLELTLAPGFNPEEFEKAGEIVTHDGAPGRMPHHPGIKGISRDVLIFMDNLVYKEPFIEALKAVQDLRAQVTALGDGVIEHLSELWSAIREIEEQIGAIPAMENLDHTPTEKRLGDGLKLVRRWEMLSRHFRSTTK